MTQSNYTFDADGRFVIEQYNDQAAFSSFLPGIAGLEGRPAWLFYVNRGQAVASFGVRNKDGAFLEFFPADKAYQLTPSRGFRTFLKISDDSGTLNHEPFQRGAGKNVRQRLLISPHEISLEEIHSPLELKIRTDLFTMPESPIAGLVRRVEITNTSSKARRIEIVDGLPQVLPFAMNQWIVKFMSRTSEAFMRVEGLEDNLACYRLKVWPTDSPQVEPVIASHFFAGFLQGQRTNLIVDAEKVFGLAGDFSRAERFFEHSALDLTQQVVANQTPSAFQTLTLSLAPGESQVFYGIYGHVTSLETLSTFKIEAAHPAYFEAKRSLNQTLIANISQRAFTLTAKPLLDAHIQQSYLDNGLRGGFSQKVPGGPLLYCFGRKHGDLERDYNDFLLQDSPYSEGNGDFRDVLQNRRMDLFFEPALDAKNIRYFFNLIQADGYNPCSLRNSHYFVKDTHLLSHYFAHYPALEAMLSREFKYAELWQCLQGDEKTPSIIEQVLSMAEEVEDAEFDRGYWSDHWTYLIDLLISYQAIFPDRMAELFVSEDYSFFDPTHYIQPRANKFVMTEQGLRQYGAVQHSPEKQALINNRQHRPYQTRTQHGLGEILHTTLLGKLLVLVCNKLATLDPAGTGIEMEADRPGWCDALNGLPGILGSAINETIELKRLTDFTLEILATLKDDCLLPQELASFLLSLKSLLQIPELSAFDFWHQSGALKENYRQQVFMGFDGATSALTLSEIQAFLHLTSQHLQKAINRAYTPQGITTYFSYEAEEIRNLGEGKFEVVRFKQQRLPLFLEGFVHALRISNLQQAQSLFQNVQESRLLDRKLGMYRLNEPLGEEALSLGRIGVFNDGWLENGSIFLHMHYKFVLEMVRSGLIETFYDQMEQLLVAFRDPAEYKRNPLENSSFLVSSGFSVDPRQHGRGCVARLSGSTVELLHLWTHLFLGAKPFRYEAGCLSFRPEPNLSKELFTTQPCTITVFGQQHQLPANSACCVLFSHTLLVFINDTRQNTFGNSAVKPRSYRIYEQDSKTMQRETTSIDGDIAQSLCNGLCERLDILLE